METQIGRRTRIRIVDRDGGGDFTDIQSALRAVSNPGGVVYVEKGSYAITSPLTIGSNVSLIGRGGVQITNNSTDPDQPTIKNSDQTNGNSRIHIAGLTLVSKSGGVSSHLIDLRKVDDSVVEDVKIDGTGRIPGKSGIYIWQGHHNRVSRCIVTNTGMGVWINDGCYCDIVENCNIYEVHVGVYLRKSCYEEILRANHCHDTQEDGTEIGRDGILIESCRNILLEGNICDYNAEHGIYLSVDPALEANSSRITVVGNICHNNKRIGIHVNGTSSYPILACTIAGNVCIGTNNQEKHGTHGIALDYYCRGNTVTANSCCNNPNNGVFERTNAAGNDYNAVVANVCAGNSDRDEDQIDIHLGGNSFEEHNIKKYQL